VGTPGYHSPAEADPEDSCPKAEVSRVVAEAEAPKTHSQAEAEVARGHTEVEDSSIRAEAEAPDLQRQAEAEVENCCSAGDLHPHQREEAESYHLDVEVPHYY
jgi:hypothetical protein